MNGFSGIDTCTIYDFETMSQDPVDGVVVSFAMLNYDPHRFAKDPYTYEELLSKCKFMKFDVADQIKSYNRKIQKSTVEWWSQQSKEAQAKIAPKPDDKSISELHHFFVVNRATNLEKIYTRRNTFDPIFMSSIMKATGNPDPYDWWLVRDTISYIEGLSYGITLDTGFIPEGLEDKFVKHDPCHDIAMDVMRMQALIQAVTAF